MLGENAFSSWPVLSGVVLIYCALKGLVKPAYMTKTYISRKWDFCYNDKKKREFRGTEKGQMQHSQQMSGDVGPSSGGLLVA